MNNDQVKQIIQGIGVMTELWSITYNGFVQQGLSPQDAIVHTKGFMSVMLGLFLNADGSGEEKET